MAEHYIPYFETSMTLDSLYPSLFIMSPLFAEKVITKMLRYRTELDKETEDKFCSIYSRYLKQLRSAENCYGVQVAAAKEDNLEAVVKQALERRNSQYKKLDAELKSALEELSQESGLSIQTIYV